MEDWPGFGAFDQAADDDFPLPPPNPGTSAAHPLLVQALLGGHVAFIDARLPLPFPTWVLLPGAEQPIQCFVKAHSVKEETAYRVLAKNSISFVPQGVIACRIARGAASEFDDALVIPVAGGLPLCKDDLADSSVVEEILNALTSLRNLHIVHGDLKPAHILVDRTKSSGSQVTLIDFNLCTVHSPTWLPRVVKDMQGKLFKNGQAPLSIPFKGNLAYASIFQHMGIHVDLSDLQSFIFLCHDLYSALPWRHFPPEQPMSMFLIFRSKLHFVYNIESSVSGTPQELLSLAQRLCACVGLGRSLDDAFIMVCTDLHRLLTGASIVCPDVRGIKAPPEVPQPPPRSSKPRKKRASDEFVSDGHTPVVAGRSSGLPPASRNVAQMMHRTSKMVEERLKDNLSKQLNCPLEQTGVVISDNDLDVDALCRNVGPEPFRRLLSKWMDITIVPSSVVPIPSSLAVFGEVAFLPSSNPGDGVSEETIRVLHKNKVFDKIRQAGNHVEDFLLAEVGDKYFSPLSLLHWFPGTKAGDASVAPFAVAVVCGGNMNSPCCVQDVLPYLQCSSPCFYLLLACGRAVVHILNDKIDADLMNLLSFSHEHSLLTGELQHLTSTDDKLTKAIFNLSVNMQQIQQQIQQQQQNFSTLLGVLTQIIPTLGPALSAQAATNAVDIHPSSAPTVQTAHNHASLAIVDSDAAVGLNELNPLGPPTSESIKSAGSPVGQKSADTM